MNELVVILLRCGKLGLVLKWAVSIMPWYKAFIASYYDSFEDLDKLALITGSVNLTVR